MSRIVDLFGLETASADRSVWPDVVTQQFCPFTRKRCIKVRKSEPEIAIGTCTVRHGKENRPVMICPFRFLQRRQIFSDCLHLLLSHEPGNQFHVVPEVRIPGGTVDYFLVSAMDRRVLDFVGLEIQTLDTTGTVWPERQRFLQEKGIADDRGEALAEKSFGMNWKMTAKTILVQLHHKIETFESVNKKLVAVVQDPLFDYMRREFSFDHLNEARIGDPMHFHSYAYEEAAGGNRLRLSHRRSTDAKGIAACLDIRSDTGVALANIVGRLEERISDETLFAIE